MLQLLLLVLFYIAGPFMLAFLVLRFIGKNAKRAVVPEIDALIAAEPRMLISLSENSRAR